MPKTNKKATHKIELTEAHLRLIANCVEIVHRCNMGQFKELFDYMQDFKAKKIGYKEKTELENFLKNQLLPDLESNEYYSGDVDKLGYQTYRDILEFLAKDLPESSWNVYRHPMSQIADEPKLKIEKL